jgi:hypothetical protein
VRGAVVDLGCPSPPPRFRPKRPRSPPPSPGSLEPSGRAAGGSRRARSRSCSRRTATGPPGAPPSERGIKLRSPPTGATAPERSRRGASAARAVPDGRTRASVREGPTVPPPGPPNARAALAGGCPTIPAAPPGTRGAARAPAIRGGPGTARSVPIGAGSVTGRAPLTPPRARRRDRVAGGGRAACVRGRGPRAAAHGAPGGPLRRSGPGGGCTKRNCATGRAGPWCAPGWRCSTPTGPMREAPRLYGGRVPEGVGVDEAAADPKRIGVGERLRSVPAGIREVPSAPERLHPPLRDRAVRELPCVAPPEARAPLEIVQGELRRSLLLRREDHPRLGRGQRARPHPAAVRGREYRVSVTVAFQCLHHRHGPAGTRIVPRDPGPLRGANPPDTAAPVVGSPAVPPTRSRRAPRERDRRRRSSAPPACRREPPGRRRAQVLLLHAERGRGGRAASAT